VYSSCLLLWSAVPALYQQGPRNVFFKWPTISVCLCCAVQFPALYQQGPQNVFFKWPTIIRWMVERSVRLRRTVLVRARRAHPQANAGSGDYPGNAWRGCNPHDGRGHLQ